MVGIYFIELIRTSKARVNKIIDIKLNPEEDRTSLLDRGHTLTMFKDFILILAYILLMVIVVSSWVYTYYFNSSNSALSLRMFAENIAQFIFAIVYLI